MQVSSTPPKTTCAVQLFWLSSREHLWERAERRILARSQSQACRLSRRQAPLIQDTCGLGTAKKERNIGAENLSTKEAYAHCELIRKTCNDEWLLNSHNYSVLTGAARVPLEFRCGT
eukprot:2851300-Amphidinium_carterae.1